MKPAPEAAQRNESFRTSKDSVNIAIQAAAVQSAVHHKTGQAEEAQAAMAQVEAFKSSIVTVTKIT